MSFDVSLLIGIAFAISIVIVFIVLDNDSSLFSIFAFLNIGLVLMVYAGLLEIWTVILNMIITFMLIIFGGRKN